MVVVFLAIGYLVGAIPFAFLLARRLGGVDIRLVGSGNLGAANVFRTTGRRPALLVALLDIAKGAAAVLLADRAGLGPVARTGMAMAAVLGHMYPPWLGFRGGKGVATACGAFAVLAPVATAGAVAAFVLTVRLTRYVSVGSLVGTVALGPLAYITGAPGVVVVGALLTGALIVVRHGSNLARLRAGTERRLGEPAS